MALWSGMNAAGAKKLSSGIDNDSKNWKEHKEVSSANLKGYQLDYWIKCCRSKFILQRTKHKDKGLNFVINQKLKDDNVAQLLGKEQMKLILSGVL